MIHRFQVQNLKSIADVDVDLSPVTVLVGKSGTGKSSFVQALRFLRDALISKPSTAIVASDSTGGGAGCTHDLRRGFSVAGIDEMFRYELSMNRGGPAQPPESERLDLGEKCLFHQVNAEHGKARWEVEPELIQVPVPGAIALGRIPSVSEIVIAFTALTAGIGCYVFSDRVLSQTARGNQQTSGLADDAGNYLGALRDVLSNLQDLRVRPRALLRHSNA